VIQECKEVIQEWWVVTQECKKPIHEWWVEEDKCLMECHHMEWGHRVENKMIGKDIKEEDIQMKCLMIQEWWVDEICLLKWTQEAIELHYMQEIWIEELHLWTIIHINLVNMIDHNTDKAIVIEDMNKSELTIIYLMEAQFEEDQTQVEDDMRMLVTHHNNKEMSEMNFSAISLERKYLRRT